MSPVPGSASESASPHSRSRLIGGIAAGFVGAAVAGQSRINGSLSGRLGGGLTGGSTAAAISTSIGMALVTALVLSRPTSRAALRTLGRQLRTGSLPWWQTLGGLGGAVFLVAQSTSVPVLGVAIFSVCAVGGQTAASLLVDRYGLGPAGRQAVTLRRAAAAALATVAVLVAVADQWSSATFSLALVLFVTAAGALGAAQQGVNGRVAVAAGDPIVAGWVNFLVALTTLLLIVAGDRLLGHGVPALPGSAWLYLGGPVGLLFIVSAAVLVRVLGVLLLGLATVAGQVIGSILLDWVAPVGGRGPSGWTFAGAALTLVAVVVAVGRPPRAVGRRR